MGDRSERSQPRDQSHCHTSTQQAHHPFVHHPNNEGYHNNSCEEFPLSDSEQRALTLLI